VKYLIKIRMLLTIAVTLVLMGFVSGVAVESTTAAENSGISFKTVEGDLRWQDGVSADKGHAVFQLDKQEDRFPKKLKWFWQGAGQVWVRVEYADNNVIYYVMKGSEAPQVDKTTFIDQNGVPRIIVPTMLELSQGSVLVDLLEDYRRYFGNNEISVKNINLGINATNHTEIRDFKIEEYARKRTSATESNTEKMQKSIHVRVQIPQGNVGKFYLVKGVEFPIQVGVRALLDNKQEGSLTVKLPETVKVTAYNSEKMELVNPRTLSIPLTMGPGYAEESFIILAKAAGTGKVEVQAKLGDKTDTVEGEMVCPNLESIRSTLYLVDEGVYPIQHGAHKITLKKELKNYIKVREDIFSTFHRLFGEEEEYDKPAGMVCGVFENNTKLNLPLHVKFSVLDENGKEIPYFRGEHIQREEAGAPPVPETVIGIGATAAQEFKVPLFADVYSVKPGIYRGMLEVSLFGTDADIAVREFDLHVEKESQIQIITGLVAVFLSLVSLLLLAFNHKKWIGRLKTSEIILIALFTAVKFSIVDIPWFIFGDVTRAALGPLGPFMHIFTGIFWDIINAMFLVTLVLLVSKPGVVIISSVVRIILHGVAFGTFNPITVLLMLSYAALADALLYFTGFTSGKRAFKECLTTFSILGGIFIVKHIYSTYTFYYIWMYMYRLFYPDWYINVNAIVSAVYSALGAVLGVYLGNKLKRVIE